MAMKCVKCGERASFSELLNVDLVSGTYVCKYCQPQFKAERDEEKRQRTIETQNQQRELNERRQKFAAKVREIILTTTPGIDGHRVKKYLGIESVEIVIGTGAFSEISSSLSDFFGARSRGFEGKLQQAKEQAMEALRHLAVQKGANAVVAVDLDYTEFNGNRIGLVINGTLVAVEPLAA